MKTIAKTSQPIMLIDPQTNEYLVHDTPAVVTWTQFFESRTGRGQITVLKGGLPDEASDAEFQKYLADSESEELAVAAYAASFEPAVEEKPAPKAKASTKKPAEKE